jgi:hypothetical protein
VDPNVRVYVTYADGTRGFTKLKVKTAKNSNVAGPNVLKDKYSTTGFINVVARGTSFASLVLGNAVKEDTEVKMSPNGESAKFEIRKGDISKGAFEIYALDESELNVGDYNVNVVVDEKTIPIKIKVKYSPGKLKADPVKVAMHVNSDSTIVMTGATATNEWRGEVSQFEAKGAATSRDKGGRDKVLLRMSTYKVSKIGKKSLGKDKFTVTLKSDIKVSDIVMENTNFDEVEISVKSLADAAIVSKIGDSKLVKNADGSADLTDEHTRNVIDALYQLLPNNAPIQYTATFKGQNVKDQKQLPQRVVAIRIVFKEK